MLPPALLTAADRLAAILMVLVDAIAPIALGATTPSLSDHAAQILFFRLSHLVTTLVRISNFGIRPPAKPATTRLHTQSTLLSSRPRPAFRLPTHPGWLLAALPDLAPAIAADLDALLADPALTALLAATPTLNRTLRPLLRSLGLDPPPPVPNPRSPGGSHPPTPNRPIPPGPAPLTPVPQSKPPPRIARIVPPSSRLYCYDIAIK